MFVLSNQFVYTCPVYNLICTFKTGFVYICTVKTGLCPGMYMDRTLHIHKHYKVETGFTFTGSKLLYKCTK